MENIDKTRLSLESSQVDKTLQFLQELECVHTPTVSPNDQIVAPGERECPICKQLMAAQRREGLTVDECPKHGVWLDAGELEAVVDRLRRGSKINSDYAYKLGYKSGYDKGYASGRRRVRR